MAAAAAFGRRKWQLWNELRSSFDVAIVHKTRSPKKQKDRAPDCPGTVSYPLCCSTTVHPPKRGGHSFKELSMKRILVALVLALSVVSVVGCGGGATTGTKK